LRWVAAHYAFSSLFEDYGEQTPIYAYLVEREDAKTLVAGRAKLTVGRVRVHSRITGESAPLSYAVLHLGDHNVHGGAGPFVEGNGYKEFTRELTDAFTHARLTDVIG